MTLRLILLTLAAALTFVACSTTTPEPTSPPPQTGSPAPPTPPTPLPPPTPPTPQPGDTTAPTIVSVSPDNAANGVEANVKIRIEFSEPMNQAATEAAYQSTDMPSVTFAWSPNGRRLEIDPAGDLEHTQAGRVYSFTIRSTAKDLAGNALTQLNSRFKTLLELTRTFRSVATLDGDVTGDGVVTSSGLFVEVGDSPTNAQVQGFLSFDLSILEVVGLTIPQRITRAQMRVFHSFSSGTPYPDLKGSREQLLAGHIVYGSTLDFSDFNSAILHDLGEISSNNLQGYKLAQQNVLESVRDDWAQRVTRENRSQFRLFFPFPTDTDGVGDKVFLKSGETLSDRPELEVTFLVPTIVP